MHIEESGNVAPDKAPEIGQILDEAAEKLNGLGVQFMLGVVDKQPQAEDGGKVHFVANLEAANLPFVLAAAAPTRAELIPIGIWVGQMLSTKK